MNLLFTICARAGSKGCKNKNISKLADVPLVNYTLAAIEMFREKEENTFSKIELAVNTDSDILVEQVKKTNVGFTYIAREPELAGDVVSKTDVIKDTLIKVEKNNSCVYDVVVDVDLTSPLRSWKDIKGVIDQLLLNISADVAFSVVESRRSPYFNMVNKKENGFFKPVIKSEYISRQQAPVCYDMNASIYAYRRGALLNENTKGIFSLKAVVWEMMDTLVLDIDRKEDLGMMELMMKYYAQWHSGIKEIYEYARDLKR